MRSAWRDLLLYVRAILVAASRAGKKERAEGAGVKFTISQQHEELTRTISVQVVADAGKKLLRVVTKYDGFVIDDDTLNPPGSSYETIVKRTEGLTPNQKHTVIVEAAHNDHTSDAGQKSWMD